MKWAEFSYKGYSAVAIFTDGEWGGEFNYPVRRFSAAFFGLTKAEAEKDFQAGVETYLEKIREIPCLEPEQQGLAGVLELMEFERRGVLYEIQLLDWPEKIDSKIATEIAELIKSTRRPLSYSQSALDELAALIERKPTLSFEEFKVWAEQVWRGGQLQATREGLAIARARAAAEEEQEEEVCHA